MEATPTSLDIPSKVQQAVRFLYATLIIGAVRSIVEAGSIFSESYSVGFGPGSVLFIMFVTLGIIWLLAYMISKRKNWARITLLILFLIGAPFSILPLLQSLSTAPFSGLLGIVQVILQLTALIYLFQRESNQWFKSFD